MPRAWGLSADVGRVASGCDPGLGRTGGKPCQPAANQAGPTALKELERELRRKDKALAETAALLVLPKKVAAIFNRDEDE